MGTKWDKEAGKVDAVVAPEVATVATEPAPAAETGVAGLVHKIEAELVDLAHKVGV